MRGSKNNSERPKSRPNGTFTLNQRHVTELLNVLVPPLKIRKQWDELGTRLEAHGPKDVLDRYVKQGGNPWALVGCLLHLLQSKQPADNRRFTEFEKCALSCLKSIETLLKIQDQFPQAVLCIAGKFRTELVQAYQARLTYENGRTLTKDCLKDRRSKQGGRPKGSQTSLLLCLIGMEFCLLFGRPRYEDILVLAKATNPDEFPDTTTSEHIRQRIRDFQRTNKRLVEISHSKLFPVPRP